jgi:hypothetical protein
MHAMSCARPHHLPRIGRTMSATMQQVTREVGRAAAALAALVAWGTLLLLLAE